MAPQRPCDAGPDPYRARPLERQGAGFRCRRRRLCRQAVSFGGNPGADPRAAAPFHRPRPVRVSVSGNPIKMTSHEYRLLAYLMHHTGRVVSRTELVEHLYDQDFDRDSNTIEVFVGRIRKKLDVDIIQTVRGLGYLLTPPTPSS